MSSISYTAKLICTPIIKFSQPYIFRLEKMYILLNL